MRILIIHSETGDTVAGVVRTEELDMMGIPYTEVFPNYNLAEIIEKSPDLREDLSLLLDTCLRPEQLGLK